MKLERLILGSIFILALFLLCYNYAFEGYYQNTSVIDLLNGYSESHIFIAGPITDMFTDGFEVYNIKDKKAYRVKTNLRVSWGSAADILGNLNSNNQIIINKIMLFKHEEVIFVILRSLIGLMLFLIVFVKFWKFDFKHLEFIRRKEK